MKQRKEIRSWQGDWFGEKRPVVRMSRGWLLVVSIQRVRWDLGRQEGSSQQG